MKLYNKTSLPTAALEAVLVAAGRAVGARTGGVVVKVTQNRSIGTSGLAQRLAFVYAWHLRGRRRGNVRKLGRMIRTDGGWFSISIPRPTTAPHDWLDAAESIFRVAMHEWVHIRDYQGGYWKPWSVRGPGGRRPPHDARPEEIRAYDAVDDATGRGATRRHQDAIIDLVIAYEQLGNALRKDYK